MAQRIDPSRRTLTIGAIVVIGCAVCWGLLVFVFLHRFSHVGPPSPQAVRDAAAAAAAKLPPKGS